MTEFALGVMVGCLGGLVLGLAFEWWLCRLPWPTFA
jgi:hypothetical protein